TLLLGVTPLPKSPQRWLLRTSKPPRPVYCKKAKKCKVSPLSFWDVDFDSLGFIEEQFGRYGDPASFSQTTPEELRKMSLGYQLKGTML
ncbi:hypothetical protein A2U01_0082030, partial [Trifolium medium]|nr:hypothetical protein [Trifolium medium]